MKNLYLILVLSALVACSGSPQKEKPACVNTPAEPFTGLPVFDLQGQYPKKEIILQDIADVRYAVLETGDKTANFWKSLEKEKPQELPVPSL